MLLKHQNKEPAMSRAVNTKILNSTLQKLNKNTSAKKDLVNSYKNLYSKVIPQTLMLNLQYYNTFLIWEMPSSTQEQHKLKHSLSTENLSSFSATQDANQITQAQPFIFEDQKFQLSHMDQAFSQLISGLPNDNFKVYDDAEAKHMFVTFQNISCVSDLQMMKKMLQSRVFSLGINMGDPLFSNIPHLLNHLNSLKTYRNSGNVLMYEKLLEIARKDREKNGTEKHQSLETEIEQNCKELLQTVGELFLNQLHLVNNGTIKGQRSKSLTSDYNWLILEKSKQTVDKEEQQVGNSSLE